MRLTTTEAARRSA